ncbi:nitrous oxide reductase accessory protein NosL [Halarcobacter ebronensis]|uniref:nitrous oxide reductase accessory protein NosL n=1 Tax=Halarcobacter ebronensis TaxID=1462615 RepID=UPI001E544889|nr:nitrous oxide reductase accessory protein NosL [Halarcobacter ebronensis]
MIEYKIKNIFRLFYLIVLLAFLSGCENRTSTDPKEIHWDRDMCERCRMVISDRKFAVEVINPTNSRVYKFDDIGCVPLWFKEENITWEDSAIIWIKDRETTKWIDAKKAFYDTISISPMAYGFGAHETKESIEQGHEIIDYQELKRRALKIGR